MHAHLIAILFLLSFLAGVGRCESAKEEWPNVPSGYYDSLPSPARLSITRKKEQLNLPEDLARQAIQAYYASTTFADAQVGRVLDALDAAGLTDNTIVVFTSDHGYHMGEHGHWQKTTLFENAAHVPLVIAGPGVEASGQSTATPAEMVDFYPTLAELCHLPAPKHLSGVSLVPALKDAAAEPRASALTQYANGYGIRTSRDWPRLIVSWRIGSVAAASHRRNRSRAGGAFLAHPAFPGSPPKRPLASRKVRVPLLCSA